ncbi:MAG TPA: tannase/feruloyl esterase family alpha/beta hydrolase [Vicinamibacteria bacterium]
MPMGRVVLRIARVASASALVLSSTLDAGASGAAQGPPSVPPGTAPPARPCGSLVTLSLPDTSISLAETVGPGSFTPPAARPLEGLPAFCRVAGVIRPSADSHVEFEVWMPATGWNRKLQGVGNGGFAGSISYDGLSRAVARGYAAASTDTGHKGTGTDATWALGHPEKMVDFGHRAIHEMTLKAKAVIEAFYGEAPRRSYFASCSNGGRQALMEAQRYPADYDGIVAGAPAAAWTRFITAFLWNAQAMADPAAHIPPAKVSAVERAVIAACDARDGVPDGVLASPATCVFDPRTIVCKAADAADCLTAPQAEALARIYAGPRARDGKALARGFPPGGETGPGGWVAWITGEAPGLSLQTVFASQCGANMVFDRPDWDFRTFDFDRDVKVVEDEVAGILNATDPDLDAFRRRGGRLILFHGWNDAALGAEETIDYVDAVRARLGTEAADSFLRLYLVPGLQHCYGGPGAYSCGGLTVPLGDAERDFSAALERWVEEGVAPGTMIATKPPEDSSPAAGATLTRPLCPYPRATVFQGMGSPDDPAAYRCEGP